MTVKTMTAANSTTIAEYEKMNGETGVSLVVDYSKVTSAVFASKTYPDALSYSEQIANWEKGYTLNRVESFRCTPLGWYWVKYSAKFNKGTYPACSLDSFKR